MASKNLTDEEKRLLEEQNKRPVSEFRAAKLEKEASKNWDLFYKRNEQRFYKDRHWTTREFEELAQTDDTEQAQKQLFEVGCGVGNFIFPLIEEGVRKFRFFACDLSPRAIALVKSHPLYSEDQIKAFTCDITTSEVHETIEAASLDIITLIFVLSAIHPEKFGYVVQNLYSLLRPGGMVLFRDYGLYDMAQLRFKAGHKIGENFYVRQDGTRCYYFADNEIKQLFESHGFETISCEYIHRRTINKKEEIDVPRIFVQAKFIKKG